MKKNNNINNEGIKSEGINKSMTFQEILEKKPDAAAIMMVFGLHCIGCMAARYETVEQGCRAHGIPDKQIDEMIKKINGIR